MLQDKGQILEVGKDKDLPLLIKKCSQEESLYLCQLSIALAEHDLPVVRPLVF